MSWDPETGRFIPGGAAGSNLPGVNSGMAGDKAVTIQDLINLGLIDAGVVTGGGTLFTPGILKLSDAVATALSAGEASVEMSSTTLFKKMSGAAGVIMGSNGLAGYDSTGATTFAIDAATGNVTLVGTITASAGAIGGFDIGTDYIRDAANSFGMASTVSFGDDVRFWSGASFANRATAPMRITESGTANFSDISVTGGNINTTGYVYATGVGATVQSSSWTIAASQTSNSVGGVIGYVTGTNTVGLLGYATQSNSFGGSFVNTGGGYAAQFLQKVNFYGQLDTSNITTGTAPFVVASTTRVSNLNVATCGTADAAPASGITGTTLASNVTASSLTSVGVLTALDVDVGTTAEFKAGGNNAFTVDSSGNINVGCSLGTGAVFVQNSQGQTTTVTTASLVGKTMTFTGGVLTAFA